jgi:hypothetical protein
MLHCKNKIIVLKPCDTAITIQKPDHIVRTCLSQYKHKLSLTLRDKRAREVEGMKLGSSRNHIV